MKKNENIDDIENVWKKAEWTLEARQIIAGIKNFPENSKILLILRHSYRKKLNRVDELLNLGITSQGYEVAKKLGTNLPKARPIRLYHSVVPRCRETAEAIKEGFEISSGKAEMKGVLEPLFKIGENAEKFSEEVLNRTPRVFIARWVAGLYPPNIMKPFTSYCQNAAKVIWTQLEKAPSKCIDVHITHDTHLVALKWGWFGLPLASEWPSFLGGFMLAINQNNLKVFAGGKFDSFEVPYWWNALK